MIKKTKRKRISLEIYTKKRNMKKKKKYKKAFKINFNNRVTC